MNYLELSKSFYIFKYLINQIAKTNTMGKRMLVPEGYVIDRELSDLSKNIIILMEDPQDEKRVLTSVMKKVGASQAMVNFPTPAVEKIDALIRLTMVANYVNHTPIRTQGDKFCFCIKYGSEGRFLTIIKHSTVRQGGVYFSTQEAAEQALDILGEDTIYTALYMNF